MLKYMKMLFRIIVLGAVYSIVQQLVSIFISSILYAFNGTFDLNDSVNLIFAVMIVSIIITFYLYYLVLEIKNKNIFSYCKFKLTKYKTIIYAFLLGISINIIAGLAINLVDFEQYETAELELLEIMITQSEFIFSILLIGIIVPVFEEILFRGLIFLELKKNVNVYLAILIQAFIFGVYHGNLIQGIFTLILGIVLGITYFWTESIWVPIFIHIGNNCFSIFLSKTLSDTIVINSEIVVLITIISIMVLGICIRHLIRCKHNKVQDNLIYD